MKRIILISLVILQATKSFAQNTFPATGNVGIGTSSPGSLLNVGTKTTNSPSTLVQFGKSVINGEARVLSLINSGGGSDQSVSMDFHNNSTWSPTGKIQVKQIGSSTTSRMHFYTYNSGLKNRMTIDHNGNVGIGTTNPSTTMHIKHSSAYYNPGGLVLENNTSTSAYNIINSSDNLFIGYNADPVNNYPQSGYSTRFYIKSNGNIGIGTNDPRSKLSVNGQVRAKEVKVLTDIQVPDYVFEESYKLRSLQETKVYITVHKHLPEIPSAREIAEDGLDLGDMNLRLLKKIEELTLYAIQQQEELEKVKIKYNELDHQFENQKALINEMASIIKRLDRLEQKP